jgi:hypothetical protein
MFEAFIRATQDKVFVIKTTWTELKRLLWFFWFIWALHVYFIVSQKHWLLHRKKLITLPTWTGIFNRRSSVCILRVNSLVTEISSDPGRNLLFSWFQCCPKILHMEMLYRPLGCSAPSCKTNNWLRGRSSSLHLHIHACIHTYRIELRDTWRLWEAVLRTEAADAKQKLSVTLHRWQYPSRWQSQCEKTSLEVAGQIYQVESMNKYSHQAPKHHCSNVCPQHPQWHKAADHEEHIKSLFESQ